MKKVLISSLFLFVLVSSCKKKNEEIVNQSIKQEDKQLINTKISNDIISLIEKSYNSKYNSSKLVFEWNSNKEESLMFGKSVITKLDTIITYGKNNEFLAIKLDNYSSETYLKDCVTEQCAPKTSLISLTKIESGDIQIDGNKYNQNYFTKNVEGSENGSSCGDKSKISINDFFDNQYYIRLDYGLCNSLQGQSSTILFNGNKLSKELLNCNERDGQEGTYESKIISDSKSKTLTISSIYKSTSKNEKSETKYQFINGKFVELKN
jgi:hypothetical protein